LYFKKNLILLLKQINIIEGGKIMEKKTEGIDDRLPKFGKNEKK